MPSALSALATSLDHGNHFGPSPKHIAPEPTASGLGGGVLSATTTLGVRATVPNAAGLYFGFDRRHHAEVVELDGQASRHVHAIQPDLFYNQYVRPSNAADTRDRCVHNPSVVWSPEVGFPKEKQHLGSSCLFGHYF
jgi:hypothetical protein